MKLQTSCCAASKRDKRITAERADLPEGRRPGRRQTPQPPTDRQPSQTAKRPATAKHREPEGPEDVRAASELSTPPACWASGDHLEKSSEQKTRATHVETARLLVQAPDLDACQRYCPGRDITNGGSNRRQGPPQQTGALRMKKSVTAERNSTFRSICGHFPLEASRSKVLET